MISFFIAYVFSSFKRNNIKENFIFFTALLVKFIAPNNTEIQNGVLAQGKFPGRTNSDGDW